MAELKKCFVVAPIGAEGSKERQHSDDVLEFIINPVITALGFEPGKRADHLDTPGDITRQILDHVVNDDLVIADLTGHNPNVFYELAIRHVARKPYIHLIKMGERIPFDVAPQRTVFIEPEKVREIERAKKELMKQVEICMAKDFVVESPVSLTLAYDRLKEGSDTDRSIAMLVEQVGYLVRQEQTRNEPSDLLQLAPEGSRSDGFRPRDLSELMRLPPGAEATLDGLNSAVNKLASAADRLNSFSDEKLQVARSSEPGAKLP